MIHKLKIFILLIISISFLPMNCIALDQLSALQIAQNVFDRDLGSDMKMVGTMELISKKGHNRVREFISMRKDSDGERKQLIRFTSPADIKGTAFLTLEKEQGHKTEQHLYLPALKRVRRIVTSQKGRSFVNSDFTYEDMQRQPVDDWNYHLQPDEVVLGQPCYVILSAPKSKTDTKYSQIISWIDKASFMPLKTFFWDKKKRHAKTYQVLNFENIDGITTETEVLMEDILSNHTTRLQNKQIRYNSNLQDHLFTTRALER